MKRALGTLELLALRGCSASDRQEDPSGNVPPDGHIGYTPEYDPSGSLPISVILITSLGDCRAHDVWEGRGFSRAALPTAASLAPFFPHLPTRKMRGITCHLMPLATGTKLGCYEIVAPLGAGGMGEVYRARDTTLGREVVGLMSTLASLPPRFCDWIPPGLSRRYLRS